MLLHEAENIRLPGARFGERAERGVHCLFASLRLGEVLVQRLEEPRILAIDLGQRVLPERRRFDFSSPGRGLSGARRGLGLGPDDG